jgi:hypothetical protein
MNVTISRSLRRAAVSISLFALMMLATALPAFAKVTLGAPTLTFGNETQTTIDITVTATAPAGAPAGFTLQWMTYADYVANGNVFTATCDASFSGAPGSSRYSLGVGDSVTVTVGDFTIDPGFSTTCGGPLICGTEYVFRVFAHANSTYNRSPFSVLYFDSTLPCTSSGGCTETQGFWKTHPDSWPVATLTLGGNSYTEAELLLILNTPDGGNALIILAKQLIAARLSIASGATPDAQVATAITDADGFIGSFTVPPVDGSTDFLAPSTAITNVVNTLDDWLNANECASDS